MSATASSIIPSETALASTSNGCRLLLDLARYYDVISRLVDILDQFATPETIPTLQVIHKPEAQLVLVCYGEIIEECSPEEQDFGEPGAESIAGLKHEQSELESEDLSYLVERCDEMFVFEKTGGEEGNLEQPEMTVGIVSQQGIELVIEPESDDDIESGFLIEHDQRPEEIGSNLSEYFVEYLQDEESVAPVQAGHIEVEDAGSICQIAVKTNHVLSPRYKCQFTACNKQFLLAKDNEEHLRKEHPDVAEPPIDLQCKYIKCPATFIDTYELHLHHKTHKPSVAASLRSKCQICRKRCRSRLELKQHMRDHLPKPRGRTKSIVSRKCEFCDEMFDAKVNVYNIHCLEKHGRALYDCFICGKNFYLLAHLNEHIRTGHDAETAESFICKSLWRSFLYHGNTTANECRLCFRLFSSAKALLQHRDLHLKELSLNCGNCGGKHYESQCTEPRPKFVSVYEKIQCDQCQKWTSKKNIKEHLATHANERNYPCTVCKKTFKVQRTANRHIQNHINAQNKNRKCYDCEQTFENENLLPGHYESAHPGKRPYNCPICGEGFYLKADLGDHSHTHSDEDRRNISVKNPVQHYQIGNARVYECTLCRRSFSAKRTTVAHFIVHTDRPFVCSLCNMSHRIQAALDDHMVDVHKLKK